MLDPLKFKKSLFRRRPRRAQDEVFMGGTRLKRFMDSVESATGSIPSPSVVSEITPIEPEAQEFRRARIPEPRRTSLPPTITPR